LGSCGTAGSWSFAAAVLMEMQQQVQHVGLRLVINEDSNGFGREKDLV